MLRATLFFLVASYQQPFPLAAHLSGLAGLLVTHGSLTQLSASGKIGWSRVSEGSVCPALTPAEQERGRQPHSCPLLLHVLGGPLITPCARGGAAISASPVANLEPLTWAAQDVRRTLWAHA